MPTLDDACSYITKIFTDCSDSIAQISPSALVFIVVAILVVGIKDVMDEFVPQQYTILNNKYTIIRWLGYVGILLLIMLCGVFDAGSFIYVNF